MIVLEMVRRKLPFIRLNTEDVPSGFTSFDPTLANGFQIDLLPDRIVANEIRAAYFRRPGTPQPLSAVSPSAHDYCKVEWLQVLQALYWQLEGRWLNAPQDILGAENKVRQLHEARRIGFNVPPTCITNDANVARQFCAQHPSIGKPLRQALTVHEGSERVIFTSRVDINDDSDVASVRACPIILQREVAKLYDVRVTVVGERVFATSIDSQSDPDTQVDWRRFSKTTLEHRATNLPGLVAERCIELTRRLNLRFGAIDLVLDQEGEYWFLEINPNGQWGWIEQRTGQPIAAAIVSELEKIANARR
jgi:glutathione synthase/RimK-type ligase-like ATP-grasp enzyme